jgi:hypothetical protein
MEKTKYIGIILTFNYFLSACGFISQTHADITQNTSQEKTNIEDLPDGNYRYCSEPASSVNINGSDSEAWCFEFNKMQKRVVGTYSYQAPKDTAHICINGIANKNKVIGVGYEEIQYSNKKPDVSKEKLAISQGEKTYIKEGFWDNSDVYPNGFNLKVSSPHFYQLLEPEQTNNTYWITIRFNDTELNLNNFYRRELRKYIFQGKTMTVFPSSQCF